MKKRNGNNFFDIDVTSLSHENLVEIIKQLENSKYVMIRKKAQKELVKRLKEKGFKNKQIAMILISNVYGERKRLSIAKDWAGALEISLEEFLKFIER